MRPREEARAVPCRWPQGNRARVALVTGAVGCHRPMAEPGCQDVQPGYAKELCAHMRTCERTQMGIAGHGGCW